jgi:hypothetical protein
MVFKEVDISFHVSDFLFDLLELGVDVFVVGVELGLTLDSLFFLLGLDGYLIHGLPIKTIIKVL